MMVDVIPRPLYMNRVRPFLGKDLIKVFVGQRRVGKSWLMLEVENELRQQAMPPTIIRVDKERHEFDAIRAFATPLSAASVRTTSTKCLRMLCVITFGLADIGSR